MKLTEARVIYMGFYFCVALGTPPIMETEVSTNLMNIIYYLEVTIMKNVMNNLFKGTTVLIGIILVMFLGIFILQTTGVVRIQDTQRAIAKTLNEEAKRLDEKELNKEAEKARKEAEEKRIEQLDKEYYKKLDELNKWYNSQR